MAVAYDNPAMFFVAAARGARQARATDLIPVDLVGIFLKEVILEEVILEEVIWREARAEMGSKRERREAKDVDLRCVDVCVERRYEASQPSKTRTAGETANKSLMQVHPTTPGSTVPYLAVVPCGSPIAGTADPKWAGQSVRVHSTAIMHVERHEAGASGKCDTGRRNEHCMGPLSRMTGMADEGPFPNASFQSLTSVLPRLFVYGWQSAASPQQGACPLRQGIRMWHKSLPCSVLQPEPAGVAVPTSATYHPSAACHLVFTGVGALCPDL